MKSNDDLQEVADNLCEAISRFVIEDAFISVFPESKSDRCGIPNDFEIIRKKIVQGNARADDLDRTRKDFENILGITRTQLARTIDGRERQLTELRSICEHAGAKARRDFDQAERKLKEIKSSVDTVTYQDAKKKSRLLYAEYNNHLMRAIEKYLGRMPKSSRSVARELLDGKALSLHDIGPDDFANIKNSELAKYIRIKFVHDL
jgi:hypothetical protein